jgi:hypothetical protein
MSYRSMAAILGGVNAGLDSYEEARRRKEEQAEIDRQRQLRTDEEAWRQESRRRQRQDWAREDDQRSQAELDKLEGALYDVDKRLTLSDQDVDALLSEINRRREKLGKPAYSKAPDVITPAIRKSLGDLQQTIMTNRNQFRPGDEEKLLTAWANQWGEHGRRFIESMAQPVSGPASLGAPGEALSYRPEPVQVNPLPGAVPDDLMRMQAPVRKDLMFRSAMPEEIPLPVEAAARMPQSGQGQSVASRLLPIPADDSEDDKFYNNAAQRIHLYAQQGGMPESIMRRMWAIDQQKGVAPPGVEFTPEIGQQFYGMKAIRAVDEERLKDADLNREQKASQFDTKTDQWEQDFKRKKAVDDARIEKMQADAQTSAIRANAAASKAAASANNAAAGHAKAMTEGQIMQELSDIKARKAKVLAEIQSARTVKEGGKYGGSTYRELPDNKLSASRRTRVEAARTELEDLSKRSAYLQGKLPGVYKGSGSSSPSPVVKVDEKAVSADLKAMRKDGYKGGAAATAVRGYLRKAGLSGKKLESETIRLMNRHFWNKR